MTTPTETPDARKAKCTGGPMDGVKIRVYPDSIITPQGKKWEWNDIHVTDGYYEVPANFGRAEKAPNLVWKTK